MYHYKKLFFIAAIILSNTIVAASGLLVTPPCDEAKLATLPRSWSANWSFPDISDIVSVSYDYRDDTVTLTLTLRTIEHLDQHEQNMFFPNTLRHGVKQHKPYWSYQSDVTCNNKKVIEEHPTEQQPQESDQGGYTIFDRRECSPDEKAIILSIEQAAQLIKNKRILFYTGAGISAAADVDTMDKLQKGLCIRNDLSTIGHILHDSESLKKYFAHFCTQAFESVPTPAHHSIAQYIQNNPEHCALITENFDFLHERSGILPYKIEARFLRTEDVSILSLIDVVVCIGLSYDDRGFIGWYKHHNPAGVLMALDLKQPSYLGNSDYVIIGDLQETVPDLLNLTLGKLP